MKIKNTIFLIELALFFLIALGIIPRLFSFVFLGIFIVFIFLRSLEESTCLFLMLIPFFMALPISESFDSLNIWRVVSIMIFVKWLFENHKRIISCFGFKKLIKNKNFLIFGGMFLLVVLSLIPAQDKLAAIKRIIYLINLSLIGFVVYDLVKKNHDFIKQALKSIIVPAIILVVIGFVQLIMTYFSNVNSFLVFWAKTVQKNLFGQDWSDIVFQSNTWLAFYKHQLSLRMFSSLTSSHTFPLFVLLSIPAMFSVLRKKHFLLAIFFSFLAAVLSGTRGIWLAFLAPVVLCFWLLIKKNKQAFKKSIPVLSIFLIAFVLAYPIFGSNQFQFSSGGTGLFEERIKSVISISEVSNKTRLLIWGKTLISIYQSPILGVGIGNFPTILGQETVYAKAGSSAHNLYLHIAGEIGIVCLSLFLYFVYELFKKAYGIYKFSDKEYLQKYGLFIFLFLSWFFVYLLTDSTFFDERIFLLFSANVALIFGVSKSLEFYKQNE